MRALHTSDWHLGRALHQEPLLGAQAGFVDFLVELVRAERIDAVLVSGDVYDRALPTPDTVALLGEALERVVDAGAGVVATSGNHDSAVRLGFASGLLSRAGVHLRSSVAGAGIPVVVDGVAIYPLPYLEPSVAAPLLGGVERTHAAVVRAAMDRVRADVAERGLPSIAMAHVFAAGAVGSDSERDIAVGGVNVVPADAFAGVGYAALGHLHRPQTVRDGVSYSGSPLAFSFGEAAQEKSVSLVEVGADLGVTVERIPTPVPRRLVVLRGEFDDLLADPQLTHAESAWCQAVLTDPIRPLGAFDRLRRRFPHLLNLEFAPRVTAATSLQQYAARSRPGRPELDVCCDFLAHVRGGAPAGEAERELLALALERSRVSQAEQTDEGGLALGAGVA